MAKIWVLQHHPGETLGTIALALESAALAWQYVRTFDGHPVPKDMKGAGGLVVMGGPMGVYEQDRYPFLREEIALIQTALRDGKPVLGVCLGSQLLAAALGARVTKGQSPEIGWFPVGLEPAAKHDRLFRGLPESFVACHLHGDIFELPAGAVALAHSGKTEFQAFRYGEKSWGLLFHAEMTRGIIEAVVREFGAGLKQMGIDGDEILARADDYLPQLETIGETIYGRWAEMVEEG
jgi:GMP synthase (glutamine-hydrolysing)